MPSSGGFTRLTNLPGQARSNVQSPLDSVQTFQNQKLPGLSTGTNPDANREALSPSQQLLSMRRPETGVSIAAKRTSDAVRATNQRLLASAQQAGQKKRAVEAAKQQSQAGQYTGQAQIQGRGATGGSQGGQVNMGGQAVTRIQSILGRFPGLRITEVGGDRAYDVAHGVARVPTSYHYDRANPAVDIAGSTAELNALYKELVRQGGWRQILWQVPGHYDHIHVAAEGGIVGDPGPMGTKTVAVEDAPTHDFGEDTVPAMLKPGEVVMTKEAADAIGPENLIAANEETAGVTEGPPPGVGAAPAQPQTRPGVDVSGLVMQAYSRLSPGVRAQTSQWQGGNIPGVRTSLANLRPGDLVAWKDGSHIAVYAGNGEIVESGDRRRKLWAPEGSVYGIALRLPGE